MSFIRNAIHPRAYISTLVRTDSRSRRSEIAPRERGTSATPARTEHVPPVRRWPLRATFWPPHLGGRHERTTPRRFRRRNQAPVHEPRTSAHLHCAYRTHGVVRDCHLGLRRSRRDGLSARDRQWILFRCRGTAAHPLPGRRTPQRQDGNGRVFR